MFQNWFYHDYYVYLKARGWYYFPHSKPTRNINEMEDFFCTKSVFDQLLYLYDEETKLEEKDSYWRKITLSIPHCIIELTFWNICQWFLNLNNG